MNSTAPPSVSFLRSWVARGKVETSDTGRMRFLSSSPLTSRRSAVTFLGWVAGFVAVMIAVVSQVVQWGRDPYLDLRVYRDALGLWLGGGDLYGVRVTEWGLPFTYPPSGAFALVPTTFGPADVVQAVWLVLSMAAVLCVVFWSFRGAGLHRSAVFGVAAILLFAAPVDRTLWFGQVNVLLMALVCADWLRRDGRWTGGFTAVAAAVKLTPAFFFVLPALQGRWRAAVRGAAIFAALLVVSAVLAWDETVEYFGSALWETERVGLASFSANQSVRGSLSRAGVDSIAVWAVAAVAVLVLGVFAAWRWRRFSPTVPLLLVALTGLLVSPISWGHHWVWVCLLPASVWCLWQAGCRWEAAAGGVVLGAVGLVDPYGLGFVADWASQPWWVTFGYSNVYVWAALLWIVVMVLGPVVRRSSGQPLGNGKHDGRLHDDGALRSR